MGLLVVTLPVALLAFVVALVRRRTVTVGIAEHVDVVRIAALTRAWRAVGLLVGLVGGGLLLVLGQRVDALGRLTSLAPVAVGAGVLLGVTVGELAARPRVGVTRSAAVETRTVRGVLPRLRTGVLGVSVLLLAGVLGVGSAWGSPDGTVSGERAFTVRCETLVDGAYTAMTSVRSPWPGTFYALPLGVALVVVLVLAALALRTVVRRPRPAPESLGLDTVLRRWSAANVVTATTFTVLGVLGPVATLVGATLLDPGCPTTAAQAAVRAVTLVVGPVAVVGAAGTLGALLVAPRIRVDDLPRPTPGDATPVGVPVR